MRRWLFTIASAIALLLCVAVNVAAPSASDRQGGGRPFEHYYHRTSAGRYVIIDLFPDALAVGWSYSTSKYFEPEKAVKVIHAWGHARMGTGPLRVRSFWNRLGLWDDPMNQQIVFGNGEQFEYHEVGLPLWFLDSALLLLALISFLPLVQRIRRRWRGCCLRCGYNLTGNTSGVCPECAAPTERVAS